MSFENVHVAIIGGGISGSVVCEQLAKRCSGVAIDVYDQGRGFGGRTCHRRILLESEGENCPSELTSKVVNPDLTEADFKSASGINWQRISLLKFDHGCQLFATQKNSQFEKCVVREWIDSGLTQEWNGRVGDVAEGMIQKDLWSETGFTPGVDTAKYSGDFFGIAPPYKTTDEEKKVYVAVGGMHRIATKTLHRMSDKHNVQLFQNVRVASTEVVKEDEIPEKEEKAIKWKLFGPSGESAAHDASEEVAKRGNHVSLGRTKMSVNSHESKTSDPYTIHSINEDVCYEYDIVIVTDISASFASWHRASASLPESVVLAMQNKIRVPLFTALIAFDGPLKLQDNLDALTFRDNEKIWFACRTSCKPGCEMESDVDCWTVVSTPQYAVKEIQRVTMQDQQTGAFIPQSYSYLTSPEGPAETLKNEFLSSLIHIRLPGENMPSVCFLTAQRWGSAYPSLINRYASSHASASSATGSKEDAVGSVVEIMGVKYDAQCMRFQTPRKSKYVEEESCAEDFYADDCLQIYYCGDFCVTNNNSAAGVEIGIGSAAMSAVACSEHVAKMINERYR